MAYQMSDEEFARIRRAGSAGVTLTRERVDAFVTRAIIERAKAIAATPSENVDLSEHAKRLFRDELNELLGLDRRSPEQLARVAGLMEIVHDETVARPWWERAADAGDEDAIDYLRELVDEEREGA